MQKEKKESHLRKKASPTKTNARETEKRNCVDKRPTRRPPLLSVYSVKEAKNSTLPGLQAMGKEQVDTDKMDKVLSKLEKLEFIASEIQTLRSTVDKINLTVAGLQKDFSRVEKDLKSVTTETGELKTSVVNLNKDVEDGKANLEKSNKKHEEDLNKLRLQLLNYEVY